MKEHYVAIVIDGTTSMKTIFEGVYDYLKQCMDSLEEKIRGNRVEARVFFSLYVFHDGTADRVDKLEKYGFTENGYDVLKNLEKLKLFGGSEDGYEPQIIPVVTKVLDDLAALGKDEDISKGIWFISDSLPAEGMVEFKYKDNVPGLRYAHFFLFRGENVSIETMTLNRHGGKKVDGVKGFNIEVLLKEKHRQDQVDRLMGIVYSTSIMK